MKIVKAHTDNCMQRSQHTPTPWKQEKGTPWSYESNGQHFMGVGFPKSVPSEQRDANMAFIVRAVNSHEELIDFLKAALPMFSRTMLYNGKPMQEAAFELIAKAEGK